MEKIPLICIPFAGGGEHSYTFFKENIPDNVQLAPIELPGRGKRMSETLLFSIEEIAEDLIQRVEPMTNSSYAIYGHSMGALLANLLTTKLNNKPIHLFVSGCEGPSSASRKEKRRHLLPKVEFLEELKSLGGVPPQLLQDQDVMDFFETILRADFQASETYKHFSQSKHYVPITVFYGDEEDISDPEAQSWQEETHQNVDTYKFSGDHFFIYEHKKRILEIIAEKLKHVTC